MKRLIRCKGHPQVHVKSMDRTFKYDEHFYILEEHMTPELESKIKMGLFEIVSGSVRSAANKAADLFRGISNNSGGNTRKTEKQGTPQEKQENPSLLTPEKISAIVREAVKEELKNHTSISGTVRKAESSKVNVPSVDKNDSVLFIRPEEQNIKGDVSVSGSTEEGSSVDNAINKLKKKGSTNAKTTKGQSDS